uniref:Uncharacterized protein n=1 Tax=Arion vulgaris TaxID=1028688 RepID=A0A0B7A985_9EUPU
MRVACKATAQEKFIKMIENKIPIKLFPIFKMTLEYHRRCYRVHALLLSSCTAAEIFLFKVGAHMAIKQSGMIMALSINMKD